MGNGVAQTLTTSCNQAVVEPYLIDAIYNNREPRKYKRYSPALRADRQGIEVHDNCIIRKLTPLECWRLQGFDDEDYHKAVSAYDKKWKAGASDSQMYKRAGNSITVNVIEEILENLLYQRKQEGSQLSLF